jgi:dihydrofolate reductase
MEVVGRLIYSALASLDGYIADQSGNFDFAEPDREVHDFINDLLGGVGTFLYGRRLYEVMVAWETIGGDQPSYIEDFARIWRGADKVVYSRTLAEVSSARTRIEPSFQAESVRQLKEAAASDLSIGGAELASQALAAELIDEVHLFLAPVLIGGGQPAFLRRDRLDLHLAGEHRFQGGMVYLQYQIPS